LGSFCSSCGVIVATTFWDSQGGNMKNIKSKRAAFLAVKKFGPKAFVATDGKRFWVATLRLGFWVCLGSGKSWAEALSKAGIELPVDAPVAGGGE
jgi:hypothetical protein